MVRDWREEILKLSKGNRIKRKKISIKNELMN
jgi:hypothetical protein